MKTVTSLVSYFLVAISMFAASDASCSEVSLAQEPADFGILVMAHGGKEAWNEAVLDAVRPLEAHYPTAVAFGMASAESLQEATTELEAQGVRRIGVVRLFVSGESWLERTRQILGLSPGAPPKKEAHENHSGGGHHDLQSTFWQIDTESAFVLSHEGLSEADEMSQVLRDRALDLSVDPERESVLILAHGPADDEENTRWIEALSQLAEPIRMEFPFRAVEVQTLREDWEEKREAAEDRIRAFVEIANAEGGRCLVVPFRVFGFGPYAEVLEDLEYESDGRGLIPHEAITVWLSRQSEALSQGPFEPSMAIDAEVPAGTN